MNGGYKMFDNDEWDIDRWHARVAKEQAEWSKKVDKEHAHIFDEFKLTASVIVLIFFILVGAFVLLVYYCRRRDRRGRVLSRTTNTTLPAAYPQQQYSTVTVMAMPVVFPSATPHPAASGPRPAPPPAAAPSAPPGSHDLPPSYEQVVPKYNPPYNPAVHPL